MVPSSLCPQNQQLHSLADWQLSPGELHWGVGRFSFLQLRGAGLPCCDGAGACRAAKRLCSYLSPWWSGACCVQLLVKPQLRHRLSPCCHSLPRSLRWKRLFFLWLCKGTHNRCHRKGVVGLICFFPPFTFLERGGQLDRESGGLGSPPASPWGSWGSRAKSQPWETRGLQLNHTAKTTNLLLGFPLALSHIACPAPTVLRASLGCCCCLAASRTTGCRTGAQAPLQHGLGWQGPQLLFFPQATAALSSRIASLAMGWTSGTPHLVLCCSTGMEYMCSEPKQGIP